jgi:hypothetical protein
MKLDPKKNDYSNTLSLLEDLSRLGAPLRGQDRDWASETVKTLKAGKLEDYDLVEFVTGEYQARLEGNEDHRTVWDYSRALLALVEEMDARGHRSPKTAKIRLELAAWR